MQNLETHKLRKYAVLTYDVSAILLSYVFAYILRVGSFKITQFEEQVVLGTLVLGLCSIPFLFVSKQHRAMWRYFSIEDVKVILRNSIYIITSFFIAMFVLTRLDNIPRTIFVIQLVLTLSSLIGGRFLYRLYTEKFFTKNASLQLKKIPTIISGINSVSENFIRSILRDPSHDYHIVAIIDKNVSKHNTRIYGVPVMGGIENLENIISHLNAKNIKPQKLIIAEENIDKDELSIYISECEKYGLSIAKLPSYTDLQTDFSDKIEPRNINIEDLLERPQNILKSANLLSLISGKKILVTGGGGTIGGELVRQIAAYSPCQIIVLENSEFNLYSISKELDSFEIPYKAIICDVRNKEKVAKIFDEFKPEIVFHAAALKHVPIAEENVEEAVSINFLGTKIVADEATKAKTEMFVLISTDKAVNPGNVMGATKRMAEKYVAYSAINSKTVFITLRFGNVLGSSGSVIPLFEDQIRRGGPITVTHPNIIRYFMTVKEAVRLVLESASIASHHPENSGSIFVLNMGEPVKIYDLAIRMIKMAGLKPGEDIEVKFTGLRPGEKLYEELFYQNEELIPTSHKDIMLSKVENNLRLDWVKLSDSILNSKVDFEIKSIISQVVPEYLIKQEKENEYS
ncbi:MAG: polysaccharide biosynthesis protein [Alphaproteobacteria bacterium]|nr:polysaccharide biosynthesis protein [Alphaproteobacteria bacterium]OJV13177.1 MAG: hypothetical protein BGO27_00025 [Alphaproteobacteria bacterium 33-17]